MKRRSGFSTSKRRAVENAFDRLGMQAKPEAVVAALARQGIEVSEEFVRSVRFDRLRAAGRMSMQAAQPHRPIRQPVVRRPTPTPRTRR